MFGIVKNMRARSGGSGLSSRRTGAVVSGIGNGVFGGVSGDTPNSSAIVLVVAALQVHIAVFTQAQVVLLYWRPSQPTL